MRSWPSAGTPRPYDEVLHEIEERDWADTHREIAPLRRAEDAVLVDTSAMDFDESRRAILDVILKERGSVRPRNKFYEFIWSILRPIFSLLHPLRVEGLENVPQEGPVLLCPNHSSAIDPILLVIALGRRYPIRIMAKQQLLKIPCSGPSCAGSGSFPSTAATRTSAP